MEDLWGALRPAGCESGNKEIDCICLRDGLSRRKQARKEGIETCVWLRVRSEPLDECEGVSPLPVCFVSAVFLFSTPHSPRRIGPHNVYFFIAPFLHDALQRHKMNIKSVARTKRR